MRHGSRPWRTTLAAAAFGLAVTAILATAPALRGLGWSLWTPATRSALSMLLVAAIAGLWLAGALRLARMVRHPGAPLSRPAALLAAFGAGPLLLALFFYPVAVALGFETAAEAATATLAAIAALAPFVLARAALARISEELLLSLFMWLVLLVLPALAGDMVGEQAARLMIALLRSACLLP